ncbi:thrombospondin-related adhesive protein [Cryptosporidium felis]|nr:thrombospondin-related adhesive protein [Cryptosporidium felis]
MRGLFSVLLLAACLLQKIACSNLTHYSVGGHKSTSRVKGRSTGGFNVPGLSDYSCPKFNKDLKGFSCWGMNTAYSVKKNSWQECANQCFYSKRTVLGNCWKFVYNKYNKECYIKNGDDRCEFESEGLTLSNRHSMLIGECATTCRVGFWSEWTPCSGVCGEMRSRSRSVDARPAEGDYCPHLVEYSNCPVAGKCPEDCPQYGVSMLGWGCQFDSTFSFKKNLFVSYEHDWKGCLTACKQDPLCASWSFNATISESPGLSKEDGSRDYRPCYLHRFTVGCQALAPGWISGGRSTRGTDCDAGSCVHNEWSPWSECEDICSNSERVSRSRTVKSVSQNWATTPCRDETQYRVCSESPESIETCQTCLVSSWSEWSECSTSCGKGVRVRTRTINKYPQNGSDSSCPELMEEEACNGEVGCPSENCVIGEWSQWSPCSATCGTGVSTRTRTVSGNQECLETVTTTETQECKSVCCEGSCEASCLAVMSVWSEWSACSEKCDQGLTRRYRDFDFSNIDVFGYVPPGTSSEQKEVREKCKDVPTMEEEACTSGTVCTPGCKYGEWSDWSACDCSGTQKRTRVVTFPDGIIDAICQSGEDTRQCSKPDGCLETAPDPGGSYIALAVGIPVGLLGVCVVMGSLFLIGTRRPSGTEEDETNYEYMEQSSRGFDRDSEYVQEIGPENQNWAS